jgi:hypothetical protein
MTNKDWDDIKEWKPTLASQKSLESMWIYNDMAG